MVKNVTTNKMMKNICVLVLTCIGMWVNAQKYNSLEHSVIDENSKKIFVTDATSKMVQIFSIKKSNDLKLIDEIKLKAKPSGITFSEDHKKLFVTCGLQKGKLVVIDAVTKQILKEISVGHSPMSPVVKGDFIYIANKHLNTIKKLDIKTYKVVEEGTVAREPVTFAISEKTNQVYVGNYLPTGKALYRDYSSKVSILKGSDLTKIKDISLPDGSNTINSILIDSKTNKAFVTHIIARYNVPTNQIERGWINTNAFSIIDLDKDELLCTVLLDEMMRGAANPYDIKVNANTNSLIVTHSGTNEISVIEYKELLERISATSTEDLTVYARDLKAITNDLSYLQDIRTRYLLKGISPRSISLNDNVAYIVSYYSGTIEAFDLKAKKVIDVCTIEQPELTLVRKGELYFQDARICKQTWQSCVSCHPGGARVDGMNWDLLNDGIGNPKNTKNLLFSHETPPSMATGIRASANVAVRSGIEHILFTEQDDKVAQAIDVYLMSLRPVQSPYLKNGRLSKKAKEGKQIFETIGCARCHNGDYYTNKKQYNLGLGKGKDKNKKFDTPTLIEIWRTAPYLHDGRASTVREAIEIIDEHSPENKTKALSEDEWEKLVTYVLSL